MDKPLCFVLMPFENQFNDIYEDLISATLSEYYTVARADNVSSHQSIIKDIIVNIASAKLIIADLTNLNPNVFYEVGIAHALNKPTVLLTQDIDKVPFDLRSYRLIPYSQNFKHADNLKTQLNNIGKALIKGQIKFGNPVSDFHPNRNSLVALSETNGMALSDDDSTDIGWLDMVASIEQDAGTSEKCMKDLTQETTSLSEFLQKSTDQINSTKAISAAQSVSKQYKISQAIAARFNDYAEKVENVTQIMHKTFEQMFSNTSRLYSRQDIVSSSKVSQVKEMADTVSNIKHLFQTMNSKIETIKGSFPVGVTQSLDKAVKNVNGKLANFQTELSIADSQYERLETILGNIITEKEKELPST